MFDSWLDLGLVGAARLTQLIEQNHAELQDRECRMLQLACAWADARVKTIIARAGPPGQTRRDNLGPFIRSGHRAATHGGWQKRQPEPGYFVHRSPNGCLYLVTNQGTLALGRTAFSNAVWQASKHHPVAIPA